MRRRITAVASSLTAEDAVEIGSRAFRTIPLGATPHEQAEHVRAVLSDYGIDPVDFLRARHWIRRGKPKGYRWRGEIKLNRFMYDPLSDQLGPD